MTILKSIVFVLTTVSSMFYAPSAFTEAKKEYWDSNTPELASSDGSIVCSRASYGDYRRVSAAIGDLGLDFSPVPQAVTDKQRIIDVLASTHPDGGATQVFVSYIPTGEVFHTQCINTTCSRKEIESPMNACLTTHWNDCVHSMVRYNKRNYCLLEVTEASE